MLWFQWYGGDVAASCIQPCLCLGTLRLLLELLRQHLLGQWFLDDGGVAAVTTWLQALDQDFFAKGFSALVSCWNKCLNRVGG
jgi:hypothetical protein